MNLISFIDREMTGRRITNDDYDYLIKKLFSLSIEDRDTYHDFLNPVLQAKFQLNSNKLATCNDFGHVSIYEANDDSFEMVCAHQPHSHAVFDIDWSINPDEMITASGDGCSKLIKIQGDSSRCVDMGFFMRHNGTVRSICYRTNDPYVFVSGGRDGALFVWDTRVGNIPQNSVQNAHACGRTNSARKSTISILCTKFLNENYFFTGGQTGALLCKWDLRKLHLSSRTPTPRAIINCRNQVDMVHGFTDIAIDPHSNRLYASCTNSHIYCYNVSNDRIAAELSTPVATYRGHHNSFNYSIDTKMTISGDCKYISSGSQDNSAYIWNVKNSNPIVRLPGHSHTVNCVSWRSFGEPVVVTISDFDCFRIWTSFRSDMDQSCQNVLNTRTYADICENYRSSKFIHKSKSILLRKGFCCDFNEICHHYPSKRRFSIYELQKMSLNSEPNIFSFAINDRAKAFLENLPENFRSNTFREHTTSNEKAANNCETQKRNANWLTEYANRSKKRSAPLEADSEQPLRVFKKIKKQTTKRCKVSFSPVRYS